MPPLPLAMENTSKKTGLNTDNIFQNEVKVVDDRSYQTVFLFFLFCCSIQCFNIAQSAV